MLLALALAACDRALPSPVGAQSSAATPRRGGSLSLASFTDIRSLDPASVSDGLAPPIYQALYAGLVDYDREGRLVPDLATRWELEDEGRTIRFFLREGARFHDGSEVTAEDVVRSAERALGPKAPNPMASFYERIEGFREFNRGDAPHLSGVRAEGRLVVRVSVSSYDATLLAVLALPSFRPVCPSGGAVVDDAWAPCGAGPFRVADGGWQRGREIRLVRHEGYFQPGLPYLDEIRWSFGMNPATQAYRFFKGELDVVRDLRQYDVARMLHDPRWQGLVEHEAAREVSAESMNTRMAPFDNVEVRRAVASAIDRDALRLLKATHLTVADRPVPPGARSGALAVRGQRFDLAEALEHMRRAGFPFDPATRRGGYPHPIPYVVYRRGLNELSAQVLAQQLARIGLRLELRLVSYPAYLALSRREGAVAMAPTGWAADFLDASDFLDPLFHSRAISPDNSNNQAFYRSDAVDDALDRARSERDPQARARLLAEAEQRVIDDAPWAFTHYHRGVVARQPRVRDLTLHPMWTYDLRATWIDRDAPSATAAQASLPRVPSDRTAPRRP